MENEKSITAKLTNVISKAAETVKHAVGQVVESASEAAQHAMEANAEKISRIPPAISDPAQVAGTSNEQVYIPEASDAAAMPIPLIPASAPKRQKPAARVAPAKPASKAAKAAAKKPAAQPPRKTGGKPAAKKSAKTAKKSPVKRSKKTGRKSR